MAFASDLIGADIEPDTTAVARSATAPNEAIDYLVAAVGLDPDSVRIRWVFWRYAVSRLKR